jgi:hypothetical protein
VPLLSPVMGGEVALPAERGTGGPSGSPSTLTVTAPDGVGPAVLDPVPWTVTVKVAAFEAEPKPSPTPAATASSTSLATITAKHQLAERMMRTQRGGPKTEAHGGNLSWERGPEMAPPGGWQMSVVEDAECGEGWAARAGCCQWGWKRGC